MHRVMMLCLHARRDVGPIAHAKRVLTFAGVVRAGSLGQVAEASRPGARIAEAQDHVRVPDAGERVAHLPSEVVLLEGLVHERRRDPGLSRFQEHPFQGLPRTNPVNWSVGRGREDGERRGLFERGMVARDAGRPEVAEGSSQPGRPRTNRIGRDASPRRLGARRPASRALSSMRDGWVRSTMSASRMRSTTRATSSGSSKTLRRAPSARAASLRVAESEGGRLRSWKGRRLVLRANSAS